MFNNDWDNLLKSEVKENYFIELNHFIDIEYAKYPCYPPRHMIYNALRKTSYNNTKVLILGQDPYHHQGQAMGLSFSVPMDVKCPPSLKNIFTELKNDLGYTSDSGDLSKWSDEGVLLLNAILTVKENQPLSHQGMGWEIFTDKIIALLNLKDTPVVFVLWGSYARKKKDLITNKHHYIIENVHPSPLSSYRGFFGSKPFSLINKYLIESNQLPIDFQL